MGVLAGMISVASDPSLVYSDGGIESKTFQPLDRTMSIDGWIKATFSTTLTTDILFQKQCLQSQRMLK